VLSDISSITARLLSTYVSNAETQLARKANLFESCSRVVSFTFGAICAQGGLACQSPLILASDISPQFSYSIRSGKEHFGTRDTDALSATHPTCQSTDYTTLCLKNDIALACYNFDEHRTIFYNF